MKNVMKYAWADALGTAVYVAAIAVFMYFLGKSFSAAPASSSVIVSIAVLMLFVFSVAFTGVLVFGRPVMWYLDGKKKEALSLLFFTLGIFLAVTVIAFILLVLIMGW